MPSGLSLRYAARLLPCGLLLCFAFATPLPAADYFSLIPSTRWITLSSPLFPTDHAECSALAKEFADEVRGLSQQHDECLAGSPPDLEHRGTCSHASCQALHTARNSASKKSAAEVRACRDKVDAHLAQVREDARKRRRAALEAEKAEREHARAEAKRQAERRNEETDRRARDARKRQQGEARAQREQQERAEAQAKAEREAAERSRREVELAQLRAREAEAKRERDANEQAQYMDLITQLKSAKDTTVAAVEFLGNPFEKTQELIADAVAEKLVDKGLDFAASFGPKKEDPRYEAVAALTDEARSQALRNNPFAEKISGLAMTGAHKINRQTLGQIDELGRAIDGFGKDDVRPTAPSASSSFRPSPPPPRGTDGAAQQSAAALDGNPFDAASRSTGNVTLTYLDPDSGRSYAIPPGRTLYRASDTDTLAVVPESQVRASPDEDHIEKGQLKCSATGKGRVLPECEMRRKQWNPFGAR